MQPQCPWCAAPITTQHWLMSTAPLYFACAQCRRSIPLKPWVVSALSIYLTVFIITVLVVVLRTLPDRGSMRIALALTIGMFVMGGVALELIILRLDPVRRS